MDDRDDNSQQKFEQDQQQEWDEAQALQPPAPDSLEYFDRYIAGDR